MLVILAASIVQSLGALKLIRAPKVSWIEFVRRLGHESPVFSLLILPATFVSAMLFNIALFSIILSFADETTAQISVASIALAFVLLFTFAASRH